MRTGACIMLFLLIPSVYCVDYFLDEFERPWNTEYKWPNNSSVVDYTYVPPLQPGWNSFELQKSLDSLVLEEVRRESEITEYVSGAKANYSKAVFSYEQIEEFIDYGISPYFYDVAGTCLSLGYGTEQCTCALQAYEYYECMNMSKQIRKFIGFRLFSDGYSKAWANTMENALLALEKSSDSVEIGFKNMEKNLENAEFAGICDEDVSGFEKCENGIYIRDVLEQNELEDEYGFVDFRNGLLEDRSELNKGVPKLQFANLVNIVWGDTGLLSILSGAEKEIQEHYNESHFRWELGLKECEEEIRVSESLKKFSEEQELWRVDMGAGFSDVLGFNGAPISDELDHADELLSNAQIKIKNADIIYKNKEEGYLKNAMLKASEAKQDASESFQAYEQAIKQAGNVRDLKKAEALEWLEKVGVKFGDGVWPERARVLFENAESKMKLGEETKKIGITFTYYSESVKSAKEAFEIDYNDQYDTDFESIYMCNLAMDLIERAYDDKIDVLTEETMLSILSKSKNTSELLLGCQEVVNGIEANAMYKYSDLEDKRRAAFDLMEKCNGGCGESKDCYDLESKVEDGELGLVYNGNIAYPNAIGSLGRLRVLYVTTIGDAKESIEKQVECYLKTESFLFVENVELDGSSEVMFEILLQNDEDNNGKDVMFSVKCPIEFLESDLAFGAENLRGVAWVDGSVVGFVRNIAAKTTERFVFEKSVIILNSGEFEIKAYGDEIGGADVIEIKEVYSSADIDNFAVPLHWEKLKINSLSVDIENGFVNQRLLEGTYVFEAEYYNPSAYLTIVVSNTSNVIGSRTYYKYVIEITPEMDMENIDLFLGIPESDYIKSKQVISLTGDKLSVVENVNGFSVQVGQIEVGRKNKLQVSYEVDNSSAYVESELNDLRTLNLSEQADIILQQAIGAMERNETNLAISKIQDIYTQINKDEKDNAKLLSEYLKIKEIVEVESMQITNSNYQELEGNFIDRLAARSEYLEELLDEVADVDLKGKVQLLSEYDKKWLQNELKNYKKNISSEINTLSKEYYGMNQYDRELELKLDATKTAYNEFSASMSLDDGLILYEKFCGVKMELNRMETDLIKQIDWIGEKLDKEREEIEDLLEIYSENFNTAKNTRFENEFLLDPKDIEKDIKEINSVLSKKDYKKIEVVYYKNLENKEEMNNSLSWLEATSKRNTNYVKDALELFKGKISEMAWDEMGSEVTEIEMAISKKEFVKALKNGDELLKNIAEFDESDDYGALLIVSLIFIISLILVYYYRKKDREKPRIFKKLEKASEF
ncbi:hypothetical protein KJ780_04275 [Candidatus Micrarchaeota archaeon]|nr:hypothetical protein [Candidatus Micrarchaeota archaeon]